MFNFIINLRVYYYFIDLMELEPSIFLNPFLEVVRSEDTTGPITGLALSSISKFLSYSLIGSFIFFLCGCYKKVTKCKDVCDISLKLCMCTVFLLMLALCISGFSY